MFKGTFFILFAYDMKKRVTLHRYTTRAVFKVRTRRAVWSLTKSRFYINVRLKGIKIQAYVKPEALHRLVLLQRSVKLVT